MTGDTRKQFLLQQVSAYFGLAITDPVVEGIAESEKVNNFLDDGNSLVLAANLESRSDGEVRIHLDNAPRPGQLEDKVLLFFKRKLHLNPLLNCCGYGLQRKPASPCYRRRYPGPQ